MEVISMNNRPSWDETRMDLVRTMAKRSVCKHYKVGVVFYREKTPVMSGYNGPPRGEPHCNEVGCAKEDEQGNKLPAGSGKCRGAHAEINGIVNAALDGISLKGCGVACTYSPCYACSKELINLGITEFLYEILYDDEEENRLVKELFQRRGVVLRQFKEE